MSEVGAQQRVQSVRGLPTQLSVVVDPIKGRCLVANRPIARGSTIVKCQPYASVLSTKFAAQRCSHCFVESSTLQRCSRCKYARYCSVNCQRRAWVEDNHKEECESLKRVSPRIPTDSTLLLSRVLHTKSKEATSYAPSADYRGSWDDIEGFVSHVDEFHKNPEEREGLTSIAVSTLHFINDDKVSVSVDKAFEMLCKFRCNAVKVSDGELREIGLGIYPVAALLNHSCSPNAVATFDGPTLQIRSIKDIDEGDEVTLNYIDVAESTPGRQATLKANFFFTCGCKKCTSDSMSERALGGFKCFNPQLCDGVSLPPNLGEEDARVVCMKCGFTSDQKNSELLSAANTALMLAGEVREVISTEDSDAEALQRARRKLTKAHELQKGILHELNYDRVSVANSIQNVSISMSDFEQAKFYAQIVLQAYEKVYEPIWPSLGLQYYTFGKLLRYFDEIHRARIILSKADNILRVTHGEHPLVRDLESLICQNEMEIAYSDGSIRSIAQ